MPLLVAHVEDVLGVVAGDGGEGESGEDDGDDAGGDEARLEGVPARIINSIKYLLQIIILLLIVLLGGRVVVLREVVQAGEDDPRERDVLGHVKVEAEHVAQGLQNADRKMEDKRNKN